MSAGKPRIDNPRNTKDLLAARRNGYDGNEPLSSRCAKDRRQRG